jgi:hypothetical protein
MYKIISAEADAHSNRIASLVFKIAVEMAIQNKLLSAGYVALTEEEMRFIRNEAINMVRRSHGFFSIEEAIKDEKRMSAL